MYLFEGSETFYFLVLRGCVEMSLGGIAGDLLESVK